MSNHPSVVANLVDSILVKGYEQGAPELNDVQRVVFFITELDTIIAMEGLIAFYDRAAGEYADDVVAALKRIGASKSAGLVRDANSLFPNSTPPRDQDARRDALRLFNEATISMIKKIGEEFMTRPDRLADKFNVFVLLNRDRLAA